jgi:prevent-host-death family protein
MSNQPRGTRARATVCYMESVSHREMRNNSGEILRRVAAGESITVTNNGRIAALIVPPATDVLAELAQRSQARPALRDVASLRTIRRRAARRTSTQIVADSRGEW